MGFISNDLWLVDVERVMVGCKEEPRPSWGLGVGGGWAGGGGQAGENLMLDVLVQVLVLLAGPSVVLCVLAVFVLRCKKEIERPMTWWTPSNCTPVPQHTPTPETALPE